MGKLQGKVAVITGATSGMALATARLFIEEGAYVFITGRRRERLDQAVKAIGKNVTGVQGDASNLADLDRLYETVKKEKGQVDILFASAGAGELGPIGSITEEQFNRISMPMCEERSHRAESAGVVQRRWFNHTERLNCRH